VERCDGRHVQTTQYACSRHINLDDLHGDVREVRYEIAELIDHWQVYTRPRSQLPVLPVVDCRRFRFAKESLHGGDVTNFVNHPGPGSCNNSMKDQRRS